MCFEFLEYFYNEKENRVEPFLICFMRNKMLKIGLIRTCIYICGGGEFFLKQ